MSNPLIIGIPTYNRADGYLKHAFKSALSQTYPNLEIIVSDNCSSDRTAELIKGMSDARVEYHRHETNIGAANNFNFCVDQAKGDYFLLLHDDDLIDADFIDTCMQAAGDSTDFGTIRTGTRIIDAKGVVTKESVNKAGGLTTEDFFKAWFESKTAFYLCSTLYNTKRLQEMGGFSSPYNLFQDVVATVQLAARYGRCEVKDIKSSFRVHEGEITSSARLKEWCGDSLYLLDVMCSLAPETSAYIRKEGTRFLARINYKFASGKKNHLERLLAHWIVFKSFNYRYAPPQVLRTMKRARALREKLYNK